MCGGWAICPLSFSLDFKLNFDRNLSKIHEAKYTYYVPCGEDIQVSASDFVDPGAKTEKSLLSIFWVTPLRFVSLNLPFQTQFDVEIVYIAIFSIAECVSR